MMIKAKDMLGLQVVSMNAGKKIETIDDVIYDPQSNRVLALLADKGGWFSDAKVILYSDVKKIGPDAVMVDSENVLRKASEVQERISHITKDDKYLTQTKIITEDGKELGSVSDIYFDDATGVVSELEVSQGIKNLQSGKKRVRVNDIITIGQDATIVKSYTEEIMQQQAQTQGIQGAYNNMSDGAPSALEKAKHSLHQATVSAEQKLHEATTKIQQKVSEVKHDPQTQAHMQAVKDKVAGGVQTVQQKVSDTKQGATDNRKQDVLGKYVNRNIMLPDGTILLHQGDMVTPDSLVLADQFGLTEQVIMSSEKDRVLPNQNDMTYATTPTIAR